ncbi:carboxymuconolactone decarboxylase family protein [Candidatus Palauibacter sp.]|uniref:carboxymuconolactone decarboxylase family protein n=1 Tax=Candidatus Palauibacter sp. TaxID=3101350 RepID=UPI003B5C579E
MAALAADHTEAGLDEADRAMLDYAARLTRTPGGTTATDIEALKARGFDDRAIHDMCAIAGYYAFVNRIADGLGVELEDRKG